MMTSVLLLQDLLAILVILLITGDKGGNISLTFGLLAGKFVLLCLLAFLGVRYIITPILSRFDVIQEYAFVVTLGWCLLSAEAAHVAGLSYEMGAFVAGLSIASCVVATAIAEHLKPLREFFLILFFFAIGANLNLRMSPLLLAGAVVFGIALVFLKTFVFKRAFLRSGENAGLSSELSIRLAQSSEFSLLVAFSASSAGLLTPDAAMVIQVATIVTFILSTYWVSLKYPTPISANPSKLQD
jgi:Kef-type K+ transport system membrane component KefB